MEEGGREPGELSLVPPHRRRDRRQGLHRRAPLIGPGCGGDRHGSWSFRVPGTEVQRRVSGVRPGLAVAAGERDSRSAARRDQDGRSEGLRELRLRGDRPIGVQGHHRLYRAREVFGGRGDPFRRRLLGRDGLLHRTDGHSRHGSEVQDDVRGDLRAGTDGARVPGRPVVRDTRPGGHDVAVRPHRGRVLARPRCDPGSDVDPARGGRQLLHQRQADWSRRGPAALRRGPGQRHERQSRFFPQPGSLGLTALDQGDVHSGDRLQIPVHEDGRG